MFINITIEISGERLDIRIDSEQIIGQTLCVLRERNILPSDFATPNYFHSRLNQRPVSAYMTFAEENIFDGDILSMIHP
ncbi:MAG: EsaB/YukD family protein [Oscillospiraceae bacterium]|jgi:hypothetical protein|nr:EsaB/YukD family protein [Oscillospiraceae bacterium]